MYSLSCKIRALAILPSNFITPNLKANFRRPAGTPFRVLLVLAISLLVVGCKVRITVPEGGRVVSDSGAFSCEAGQTCDIDVSDVFFDETFRAQAKAGYFFRKWEAGDRLLCGESYQECHLFTTFFAGNAALEQFLESGEIFYLRPMFTSGSCTPYEITGKSIEGDLEYINRYQRCKLASDPPKSTGQKQGLETWHQRFTGQSFSLRYQVFYDFQSHREEQTIYSTTLEGKSVKQRTVLKISNYNFSWPDVWITWLYRYDGSFDRKVSHILSGSIPEGKVVTLNQNMTLYTEQSWIYAPARGSDYYPDGLWKTYRVCDNQLYSQGLWKKGFIQNWGRNLQAFQRSAHHRKIDP